jgi:aminomethyltransferase
VETSGGELARSPLYEEHVALGAKLTEFGGWEMPLSYPDGTVAEHLACRSSAVAFDVSHLGTVRAEGRGVFDALQRALTNDLAKIGPGRAQYTHLLADDGSVLDDMIVWWVADDRFDVMPNASNTERVRAVIPGVDVTAERAVIALQGPTARAVLARVAANAADVPRFSVREFAWRGAPCVVAGTGYTGEDGVECAVPAAAAPEFWRAALAAGAVPAGLGARDTLRLEAALPLHGHELGEGITPLQAGLSWVVAWGKERFTGKAALEAERAAGPARRLRGLVTKTRQPPRADAGVTTDGEGIGIVTSGNFSPMLKVGIALALSTPKEGPSVGDAVEITLERRSLPATVTATPFWPPRAKVA